VKSLLIVHTATNKTPPNNAQRCRISFQRHCEEPTGPAQSGRPDDRLRDEAIQVDSFDWIASPALAMTTRTINLEQ
jgi:hypothetical protein